MPSRLVFPPRTGRSGFTLVEMLASMAVLTVILLALAGLTEMTRRSYRTTMGNLDSFESARTTFELLSRLLSQATLMSYLSYNDPALPTTYELRSDLHFLSAAQSELGLAGTGAEQSHAVFFQATLGSTGTHALGDTGTLLVGTGFFIAHGEDPLLPTPLKGKVENRHRYRLFQYLPPREQMKVYEQTLAIENGVPVADPGFHGADWFLPDVEKRTHCHPLAENVVYLGIMPMVDSVPRYQWNSRDKTSPATLHRLPHSLKIILAAIDEPSAARIAQDEAPPVILPEHLFEEPAKYAEDLAALEAALAGFTPRLNYRVFTTEIRLGASNSSL